MSEATHPSTDLSFQQDDAHLVEEAALEAKPTLAEMLGSTEMIRQITLIVALVISVGIAVFIVIWAQEPEFRPLGKFQTEELIQTLDYLDANRIEYKLEGDVVRVREKDFQNIKLGMARSGLVQQVDEGNQIIMSDMGFGVSQRVEMERLKHAREMKIARAIEEISGVQRAKVLLAIPPENVFARKEKKPSATVVVTANRGTMISGEEVDSIVDIVASAVPNMAPEQVTVTDSNGRLLNSGSQDSLSSRARKEYEIEQQREAEYIAKIDSILVPVIGLGNYTAQVDVTMDFTSKEQTQRRFNPDLPAVRSEMIIEENSVGGVVAGVPGALTNQPPLDANIPENANGEGNGPTPVPGRNSKEQTRNYELDTTLSYTKQQTGVIRRLSVSVAVDYQNTTDAEGNPVQTPRSQAELLNLRRLLQGGLGFDVTRGDSLEVVTIPFSRVDVTPEEIPWYEHPQVLEIGKMLTAALVIMVLMIAIVRPMMQRLMTKEADLDVHTFEDDEALDLGEETISMLTDELDDADIGFSDGGQLMLPSLDKGDDVLKAVRALVANEPELSSQVVRGWILDDE